VLPHGRLIMLPGTGHMLHYAAPEVVIAAIDELAANPAKSR
jgi:pimeloyl-ACP methyl ester carboxylesterase